MNKDETRKVYDLIMINRNCGQNLDAERSLFPEITTKVVRDYEKDYQERLKKEHKPDCSLRDGHWYKVCTCKGPVGELAG